MIQVVPGISGTGMDKFVLVPDFSNVKSLFRHGKKLLGSSSLELLTVFLLFYVFFLLPLISADWHYFLFS